MGVREAGSLYSCKKVPRSVVGEKSCYAEMSADVLTLLSVSERKKKKVAYHPLWRTQRKEFIREPSKVISDDHATISPSPKQVVKKRLPHQ